MRSNNARAQEPLNKPPLGGHTQLLGRPYSLKLLLQPHSTPPSSESSRRFDHPSSLHQCNPSNDSSHQVDHPSSNSGQQPSRATHSEDPLQPEGSPRSSTAGLLHIGPTQPHPALSESLSARAVPEHSLKSCAQHEVVEGATNSATPQVGGSNSSSSCSTAPAHKGQVHVEEGAAQQALLHQGSAAGVPAPALHRALSTLQKHARGTRPAPGLSFEPFYMGIKRAPRAPPPALLTLSPPPQPQSLAELRRSLADRDPAGMSTEAMQQKNEDGLPLPPTLAHDQQGGCTAELSHGQQAEEWEGWKVESGGFVDEALGAAWTAAHARQQQLIQQVRQL